MCGILVFIGRNNPETVVWNHLIRAIRNRGPDYQHQLVFDLENHRKLILASSVLYIRQQTPQPLIGKGILLWNGEIFGGIQIQEAQNDGQVLLDGLDATKTSIELLKLISKIKGPFSFVYYQQETKVLWFGKDVFGRRSLLKSKDDDFILVSSTIVNNGLFDEISGIHCLDLTTMVCTDYEWGSEYLKPSFDLTIESVGKTSQTRFLELLDQSVYRRVGIRARGKNRLAILFSGGLDSAVLARMVDKHVPVDEEIDLLNMIFDDEGKVSASDRTNGFESYKELQTLSDRKWNFVAIDVRKDDFLINKDRIVSLMQPANTAMDLSISIPFWFCGKGEGLVLGQKYNTTAKILIVGFGADELLGGYYRYRTMYAHQGLAALEKEMKFDFERMWKRNLARDDRCLSDHGKETRFPYLDEDLVSFLTLLPSQEKFDLAIPLGDKLLLRKTALDLGLRFSSQLQKRAIQFGSRSSKIVPSSSGTRTID